MYLSQQRKQLDESWTLLQQMERQQQQQQEVGGASTEVAVEMAQSGTIHPPRVGRSRGVGRASGGVGGASGMGGARNSGVDLSALYENCKRK